MLALQVYTTLRPDRSHADRLIAGTGTLAEDGSVGAIEGAKQKLIAAEHVGASMFLVPRGNYAEVAKEQSIRVVPVGSFKEALKVLGL
jgi:PDZ domain-containing protein